MNAVIHQYFKCRLEDLEILVRINPETFEGLEIQIDSKGRMVKTKRQFDEHIYQELEVDGFAEASAMEFNLYLKGLASPDFSV